MFISKTPTIPMVYSYLRFSSMGQADGTSEARQHETVEVYAETYANANGMKLATPMQDRGKSAWKGTHRKSGDMGGFIASVEAGKVAPGSVFIVEDMDRFSRERGGVALQTLITFMQRGITVITTRDGATYTPADWDKTHKLVPLVCYINAAHEYSERLSGRVKKAKTMALEIARTTGKPLSRNCPAWLAVSPDGSRYDVIPARAEAVRRIFALAVSGMGSHAIAARLNDEKIPAFNAAAWSHKAVNYIVTARSPMGELTPANGAPLPSYYPAIITLETWQAAQQARKANATSVRGKVATTGGAVVRNLFTNLVFCAHCGGKMVFNAGKSRAGGAPRLRLYCENALAHAGCTASGSVPYAALETGVLARLGYMDRAGLLNDSTDAGAEIEQEVSRIALAIESATQELDAMASGFGANPPAALLAMMARKGADIDAMQTRLADAQARLADARPVITMADHTAALAALRERAEAGDTEARTRVRTALRALVDRIECSATTKVCAVQVCRSAYSFMVGADGETYDFARHVAAFGEGITPVMLPTAGNAGQSAGLSRLLTRVAIEAEKTP